MAGNLKVRKCHGGQRYPPSAFQSLKGFVRSVYTFVLYECKAVNILIFLKCKLHV